MSNSKMKPLLAIIMVNVLWGIDFVVIEYLVKYISPQMITLMRVGLSLMALIIIYAVTKKKFHINKEDWPRVFICGSVGMAIYFSVESLGTSLTSANFTSLIMATVPIFGLISDRLFFGNKITVLKSICVLASIVGVYLIVAGDLGGSNIKGLLVMIAAAIIWTFYIVYTKPLYEKYDLMTILTGLFASAFVTIIPICLLTSKFITVTITPAVGGVLVVSTIICILIGEFAYVYAIGKLPVVMVSIFENVLPLSTVIVSLVVFGTMLTPMQIAGGLTIMTAVTVLALKGENQE